MSTNKNEELQILLNLVSDSSSEPSQSSFQAASVPEFLRNGWLLSFEGNKILLGWGEWRKGRTSQDVSEDTTQGSTQSAQCALFAPDFHLQDETPWRATPNWTLVERDRLLTLLLDLEPSNVNAGEQRFQWVEPDQGDFAQAWEEIQNGFTGRGLRKAVPVVFAEAQGQLDLGRKAQILANLLKAPSTLHLYGVWGTNGSSDWGMIGGTPEILFSKQGLELDTVAIAGTRSKTTEPREVVDREFLNDPKERHEHQLVIDDLRETLAPVGDLEVSETRVLELPALYHLMTPIHAKLQRSMTAAELAPLLHPTPALGLSPRKMGFSEMARWGVLDKRGRFGAPFGVSISSKAGIDIQKCVVAIRNIQWQDGRILLGSGCGIVPQSNFDREWIELRAKRESVKRLMDL